MGKQINKMNLPLKAATLKELKSHYIPLVDYAALAEGTHSAIPVNSETPFPVRSSMERKNTHILVSFNTTMHCSCPIWRDRLMPYCPNIFRKVLVKLVEKLFLQMRLAIPTYLFLFTH